MKTTALWGAPQSSEETELTILRKHLSEISFGCCQRCNISEEDVLQKGEKGFVVVDTRSSAHMFEASFDLEHHQLVCRSCFELTYKASEKDRLPMVVSAITDMLLALGVSPDDENFKETPRRFGSYLVSHFISKEATKRVIEDVQGSIFSSQANDMIIQKNIHLNSLCPHHLLPILYTADVSYIPEGKVIGLSKLSRLAEITLKQPLVQETATVLLADILQRTLHTKHVAVYLKGVHTCMTVRGVKQHDAVTITSAIRGHFASEPATRAEFQSIIHENVR